MRNLALKLAENLESIEHDRGAFKAKCLVCHDPDDTHWDLILWADWFEADERARLNYLIEKLVKPLSAEELMYFNAVITFDAHDDTPFLQSLQKIQRHYDQGAYHAAWGDDVVRIPLYHPHVSFVVPLGQRLLETVESQCDLGHYAEGRNRTLPSSPSAKRTCR